jgi:hypothetical protein
MPFRFQRRISVAPGIRLNLSKRSISTSIGGRGSWFTIGTRGIRTSLGAPGTGVSWYKERRWNSFPPKPPRQSSKASVRITMAEPEVVLKYSDGTTVRRPMSAAPAAAPAAQSNPNLVNIIGKIIWGIVLFCVVAGILSAIVARSPGPPTTAYTAATTPPVAATAFQHGLDDRQSWETWFRAQSGQYQTGALWWSGQRSLAHPGTCASLKGDAVAGCEAAKVRLAPTDTLRLADAEYRQGWNSWRVGQ